MIPLTDIQLYVLKMHARMGPIGIPGHHGMAVAQRELYEMGLLDMPEGWFMMTEAGNDELAARGIPNPPEPDVDLEEMRQLANAKRSGTASKLDLAMLIIMQMELRGRSGRE